MKYDIGLTYSAARASPRTLSESDLAEICTTAGWVHDNAQAVCIIMHESNGKTDALSNNNPGGPDHRNIGIFQVWAGNVQHPDYLKDPVYCANVSRRIYRASGNSWKQWATAPQCAGKTGNVPPGDEAQEDNGILGNVTGGIGDVTSGIADAIGGQITGILNGIPWFRLGKGLLGYMLLSAGAFSMIFIIANKANKTPIVRTAKKAII